ncbi:hypothetical protein WK34_06010 [Burkholderia vietnamiensis]|nr:hypothetical protein WK34_06010 [Burkholderia vietnamiensis]
MRAHQVQRCGLALVMGQHYLQPSRLNVIAYVQPGFVGQSFPRYRQASHDVGIVAEKWTGDLHCLITYRPAVMRTPIERIQQTVMLG